MNLLKRAERAGRRLLITLLGWMFGVRKRPINDLGDQLRILVVRMDERVGNLLLLTPLLDSLRARFPDARIELLAHPRAQTLLGPRAGLDHVIPITKRRFLRKNGIVRCALSLRRHRYDLAIDGTNPTDPSVTQAIIVRLSGARHTLGFDHAGFGYMFSAPVAVSRNISHEVAMRLQLLNALPGSSTVSRVQLGYTPTLAAYPSLEKYVEDVPQPFGIINLGARTKEKQLSPAVYAQIAARLAAAGLQPVLTYGPQEGDLASAVHAACPAAHLAPPTDLLGLAGLMHQARAVISCDTGPMHLAVAVGTPTCALFVSTPPERYGYTEWPHTVVDMRGKQVAKALENVTDWLARLSPA